MLFFIHFIFVSRFDSHWVSIAADDIVQINLHSKTSEYSEKEGHTARSLALANTVSLFIIVDILSFLLMQLSLLYSFFGLFLFPIVVVVFFVVVETLSF